MINVRLLGAFSALRADGVQANFRTSKAAELIARLALQPSRSTTRLQLATEIWPEGDEQKALSSLRVALTYVKSGFDNASPIITEASSLRLGSEAVSDWDEVIRLERLARMAGDFTQRSSLLLTLESRLQPPLLLDWRSEWIEPFRADQVRKRILILRQLGDEFANQGMWEPAAEYARRALELDPRSEEAMKTRLRFLGQMNRVDEARAEFLQFAQGLKNDLDLQVSPSLRSFARFVCDGGLADKDLRPLTGRQQEFFAHILQHFVAHDPERLLSMFASADINWTAVLHERELLPFLETILRKTSGWSKDRRAVAKRLMQVYAQSYSHEQLRELTSTMGAEIPENDPDQIAIHNYNALVLQSLGKYDQALAEYAKADKVSTELCLGYLYAVTQVNRAVTLGNAGRISESRIAYLEGIRSLDEDSSPNGRLSLSIALSCLMGLELMDGNVSEALQIGERWQTVYEHSVIAQVEHGGRITYGLALLLAGDRRGFEFVLVGLERVMSRQHTAFMVTSAVLACWALAIVDELDATRSVSTALVEIFEMNNWALPFVLTQIVKSVGFKGDRISDDLLDVPALLLWSYEQIAAAQKDPKIACLAD